MKMAWIAAVAAMAAVSAHAGTETYKIIGTGSGSLGSKDFSDKKFTFTLTGNTANISEIYGGVYALDPLTKASVTITGIGSTVFEIPKRLGINTDNDDAVFFSQSGGDATDLFDF